MRIIPGLAGLHALASEAAALQYAPGGHEIAKGSRAKKSKKRQQISEPLDFTPAAAWMLPELGRIDAVDGKLLVSVEGVLLWRLHGATLYDWEEAPRELPLVADQRGLQRGEVHWSLDGLSLASTCQEGKLQVLQVDSEEVKVYAHGFQGFPRISWKTALVLWKPKERYVQLETGAETDLLLEIFMLRSRPTDLVRGASHTWHCLKLQRCAGDLALRLGSFATSELH